MPGKIKVKTFCLLPSSLSHVTQRAPYPRPAVAHFQRIPKHGVGEPFNGLCFAGFKKKNKKTKGMKLMLDVILPWLQINILIHKHWLGHLLKAPRPLFNSMKEIPTLWSHAWAHASYVYYEPQPQNAVFAPLLSSYPVSHQFWWKETQNTL